MRILFVCSGNTCRSPMAEAMFKKISQERKLDVQAFGAGIMTADGLSASDNAISVMRELDINLADYKSTDISSVDIESFDLFVPMTLSHAKSLISLGVDKKKIYLFSSDVSDPYGGSAEVYRATRDELAEKLNALADFVEEKLK